MTPLSARLETIVQLLRPCAVLADVGTDHGLVPVAAVERGVAERALAVDLRDAPLRNARRNIERAGVAARVVLLQGDGFLPLQNQPVDAAVMAGMSGILMVRLCEAAPQVLATLQQLVVAPNKDVPLVRAWARGNGWHLRDERMVQERGRFFTVCALVKGSGADPAYAVSGWTAEALCLVGPHLLLRKDPVALGYCAEQRARLGDLVQDGVGGLGSELASYQAACQYMG